MKTRSGINRRTVLTSSLVGGAFMARPALAASSLGKSESPVVDTTADTAPIRRTLHEIDLPVTIEAEAAGLRMAIDDKVLTIKHDAARNRLRVTVEKRASGDG